MQATFPLSKRPMMKGGTMMLDVTLDVDVETGLLQVVYPFPYNGTAFYLVGVTPEGVVNAVQPLPSKASQPTDGQLKAVVRHK